MNLIFVGLGLSTMFIFLFRIEWLFKIQTFLIILAIDLMLFILSHILIDNNYDNPRMVAALKMPLISSIIFFLLYKTFSKIYKRNPENTFWKFTKKAVEDVIFSLLFWLLGVGLPFFMVEY